MQPTIGRIVNYINEASIREPALIVAVHDEEHITIVAWNTGGTARTFTNVKIGTSPGAWAWPAITVPAKPAPKP